MVFWEIPYMASMHWGNDDEAKHELHSFEESQGGEKKQKAQ
jgi:hypothetical protein